VARTDLPWKKPIRALVMASFVTPPFLGAFAWTLLAGPNAGALNKFYRAVTGSEDALFNIFSMPGLIFVMALYSFPFVFSMIANVCELISSDLGRRFSARASGLPGPSRCRWRCQRGCGGTSGFAIAVALRRAGDSQLFGGHTRSTQIWTLFQYPPRLDMAAAFPCRCCWRDAIAGRAKKSSGARLQHDRRETRQAINPARLAGFRCSLCSVFFRFRFLPWIL
jgi:iron(III) transport system permease protein